ncbi:MAG: hypothetical protein MUP36_00695 [Demequinaceae bacterium]|nr:hypothetical protein [Demequinaceae bacterium]
MAEASRRWSNPRVIAAVGVGVAAVLVTAALVWPRPETMRASVIAYVDPGFEGDYWDHEITELELKYVVDCGQSLHAARVVHEDSDRVDVEVWLTPGECATTGTEEPTEEWVTVQLSENLGMRYVYAFGESVPAVPNEWLALVTVLDLASSDGEPTGLEAYFRVDEDGSPPADGYWASHPWVWLEYAEMQLGGGASVAEEVAAQAEIGYGAILVVLDADDLAEVLANPDGYIDLRDYGLEVAEETLLTEPWAAGINPESGRLLAVPGQGGTYYLAVPRVGLAFEQDLANDVVEWLLELPVALGG